MKKRLIVIDVSNFIFRAFFAIRMLNAPDGTPVNAIHGVLSMFLKLFKDYQPTHLFLARDTKDGSFRNELYSEYKANRTEPPEELIPQFPLIETLIEKMKLPCFSHKAYEADDIIGSACVQWKDDFDEILIASGDKDLMQFVGDNVKMLDTMKDKIYDEKAVIEKMGVRPDQIVDYLSMVGDSSDNIPGMRGIGAKGAAKLLAEYDTLEECIKNKDQMKGKKLINAFENHVEDALLSKKLIQIVTDMDLGHKSEETQVQFSPSDDLINFLRDLGFRTLINKVESFKIEGEGESGPTVEESFAGMTKLVQSDEDFEQALAKIEASSGISLHTEYNGSDLTEKEIASIATSTDGEEAFYFPFAHEKEKNLKASHLKTLLEKTWSREDLEIASEHFKRDLGYALLKGIDFRAQSFDIIQVHYILNTNSNHNIGKIVENYLGRDLKTWNKKDNPFVSSLELQEAIDPCGDMAISLFRLTTLFKEKLKEQELEKVYYQIDDPLMKILSEMENEGIRLNTNYLNDFAKELQVKLKEIEDMIDAEVGEHFNLNSPKQVGEVLFERLGLPVIKKTKTGYSTDVEVLEELESRDLSPVPRMLLQYREIGKLLSTYVKPLPLLVNKKTKRLHTHFNQHVANTGRLASNNPNLQNIPIRSELGRRIRKAFIAKKGYALIAADYSQVELRLLAHLSQDPTMVEAFQKGVDIHSQTASEVLGVSLADVTSDDRAKAKAVNFGLMYGQSSFGLAKALKISRKEAKEYIENYFLRFNSVKGYLDELKEACEKTGYAITMFGRKRYLPDIQSKNRTIKAMAERMAINSPIQGSAADMIKKAMINIDRELKAKQLKTKMLLQVHDELIFEVPEDEINIVKPIIVEGMENVVELSVPLVVDVGLGVNWFDLK